VRLVTRGRGFSPTTIGHTKVMGIDDKTKNEGQDLKGQAKEKVGGAIGNEQMQAEGKGDQASAGLKKAGEKAKDAVSDVKDAFKK
jgi:uncharacterized protein YjbJ (UPF0337 family)